MAKEFLLPDPGEGIHEADILEIHVSAGDQVKDGDPLFTVETDKAVVEIPSSFDGEIVEIRVEAGRSVEVGEVLLTYSDAAGEPEEGEEEPEEEPQESPPEESQPGEGPPPDPDEAPPRRPRGRPEKDRPRRDRPVPASPATRSLATRLDVDLHQIEGSGPEGRIEPQDVQAAASRPEDDARAADRRREERPAEQGEHGPVEWVELGSVRKATARHMATSWQEIPHVTHQDVADVTGLEEFRKAHASEIEDHDGKLSITAFLVKAAQVALREHPRFNATLDMDGMRVGLRRYYNIGVAVDTEDGLVVPVIDDVDRKSILEIAVALTDLARRMRSGDRSLDDMRGGTFTVTNPGGIGGTGFTPIINHPEVAILGAASLREVPVVTDVHAAEGEQGRTFDIAPRLHLPLILAFDHRVNDGADAARFLNTVKSMLEDFPRFLLRA